jgi:hypothetical protein
VDARTISSYLVKMGYLPVGVLGVCRMWDLDDLGAISVLSGGAHMRDERSSSASTHAGGTQGTHGSTHGGSFSSSTHGGGGGGGGGGFLGSSIHGGFLGSSVHGKGVRASLGLKRSSITSFIGGGVDQLASVFSLKAVAALAPEKAAAGAYGKITSFGLMLHPYFTSGCYVLCSKANTFAIMQVSTVCLSFNEHVVVHTRRSKSTVLYIPLQHGNNSCKYVVLPCRTRIAVHTTRLAACTRTSARATAQLR